MNSRKKQNPIGRRSHAGSFSARRLGQFLERLEPRELLSASHPAVRPVHPATEPRVGSPIVAPPATIVGKHAPLGTAAAAGVAAGYLPKQIRTAYGLDQASFGGLKGDGAGQTIAIIDWGDD